jgi:hypothetical protein
MIWRYVEKKVKNNFYPGLYYWHHNIPRQLRTSVYKKHGLNVRFEFIPELWSPMLYYWYFGKYKGYHYPTGDDIQFFYFTLFKKNGFIFILTCCIIYRNCFLDLLILLFKSGIAFYLIVHLIYITLYARKLIRICLKRVYRTPSNCILTLIIITLNYLLNIFNPKKKNKWYF